MINWPLGSWDTPSGNRIVVSLTPENGSGVRLLRCEWDRFPPSKKDQRHYREVIAPQVVSRACEYLELVGKVLYVEAGELT